MKHDLAQENLPEQLVEAFRDELSEAVASLNRDLLIVEANESERECRASIDRSLRLAHSLKGASRVVQAIAIEEVCHHLEEVLLVLQDGRLAPTRELMQSLFAAVDGLARAGQALDSLDTLDLAHLARDLQVRLSALRATASAVERTESIPDPELDALLVALHRDLGRWLEARRKLPSGSDSARFLAPFRGLEDELSEMADSLKLSIEEMAECHVGQTGRFRGTLSPPAGSDPDKPADQPIDKPTGRRLLVVDDSPTMRAFQREILEQAGYAVLTASDGVEGLALFHRHGADLIITDVDMPNMNGHEMTQAVRAGDAHSDVPIVMVTGLDAYMDRAHAARFGVNEYLIKSLDNQQQLITVIESLLSQS